MITIAFANQKGGVGKTTTAVTLGHALAILGYKTLIIDTDPQGHIAIALGHRKSAGLYRWIVDDDPLEKVAIEARINLWIVPGDKSTEKAKRYLVASDFRESAFQVRLAEIEHDYEMVLIDMAPSLDVLHVASLVACDWMVVPTRLDYLAVDGVNEVLRTFGEINRHGGQAQGYSIIPTFFERSTRETLYQFNALVKTFGAAVLAPVPTDTKAREAAAHGLTLWEYAPRSTALIGYNGYGGGYMSILSSLLERWGV